MANGESAKLGDEANSFPSSSTHGEGASTAEGAPYHGPVTCLETFLSRVEDAARAAARRYSQTRRFSSWKVQAEQFWKDPSSTIRLIKDQVSRNAYRVSAVIRSQRVRDKNRPIVLFDLADYAVQRTFIDAFSKCILSNIDSSVCFGVAPDENDIVPGIKQLVREVVDARKTGFPWALKADIKSFFPSVDRQLLSKKLTSVLDPTVEQLVTAILNPALSFKSTSDRRLLESSVVPGQGLVQGAATSSLFGNFYLADFDREISNEYKLFRYADDIIVLTRTKEEAVECHSKISVALARIGLQIDQLGENKCQIVPPSLAISLLGVKLQPGGDIHPGEKAIQRLVARISDRCSNLDGKQCMAPVDVLIDCRNGILGWCHAFSWCKMSRELRNASGIIENQMTNAIMSEQLFKAAARKSKALKREFGFPILIDVFNEVSRAGGNKMPDEEISKILEEFALDAFPANWSELS